MRILKSFGDGREGAAPDSVVKPTTERPPTIFLNSDIARTMSGRNQIPNLVGVAVRMNRDGCIRIATGDRWLSLDSGLDPAAVRAVLDECYRMLRAEAERA